MSDIALALVYYAVFLFSTTLHEAAHAWAAMRGGDLTAYHGGQVTLDPLPHIRREPFGMVVLPLLTALTTGWPFGFASAPYDRDWAQRHPNRAALMSLAGPGANLCLVLVSAALLRAGVAAGVFDAPERVSFGHLAISHAGDVWSGAAVLLGILFSLNLLLAAFNMLPLPPLDGSGALPLVLSPTATRRYQDVMWSTPMIGWMGMMLAWQIFDDLFAPLFFAAVNLLYPGVTYS